ncbi:MAG: hypothetical protein ABI068_06475 [Ktedonobacterales bacterium]
MSVPSCQLQRHNPNATRWASRCAGLRALLEAQPDMRVAPKLNLSHRSDILRYARLVDLVQPNTFG